MNYQIIKGHQDRANSFILVKNTLIDIIELRSTLPVSQVLEQFNHLPPEQSENLIGGS